VLQRTKVQFFVVAPDLRVAVAVARRERRRQLADAKAFADGWTSRIEQRSLALAFEDLEPKPNDALAGARDVYAVRRLVAAVAITSGLVALGGSASVGDDGVNVWVTLPPGIAAAAVVEQVAKLGELVAPGEPFLLRPGWRGVIRLNAASVPVEIAAEAGRALAAAALGTTSVDSDSFAV
jgi:DNA-binding transcriptional MocR family regulator